MGAKVIHKRQVVEANQHWPQSRVPFLGRGSRIADPSVDGLAKRAGNRYGSRPPKSLLFAFAGLGGLVELLHVRRRRVQSLGTRGGAGADRVAVTQVRRQRVAADPNRHVLRSLLALRVVTDRHLLCRILIFRSRRGRTAGRRVAESGKRCQGSQREYDCQAVSNHQTWAACALRHGNPLGELRSPGRVPDQRAAKRTASIVAAATRARSTASRATPATRIRRPLPATSATPQASPNSVTAGISQSQSRPACTRYARYAGSTAAERASRRRSASGSPNASRTSASPAGPSSASDSR